MEIAKYYDQRLVDKELLPLGELLREQLQKDIKAVLNVENNENLMQSDPWDLNRFAFATSTLSH